MRSILLGGDEPCGLRPRPPRLEAEIVEYEVFVLRALQRNFVKNGTVIIEKYHGFSSMSFCHNCPVLPQKAIDADPITTSAYWNLLPFPLPFFGRENFVRHSEGCV